MNHCDVLILGAGPTGLMMAAELARYGLKCRLIDKSPNPSEHSKALAIQPRTLEIFHYLGIDTEFLQKGHRVKALNILSKDKLIGHMELNSLQSPFPFILSIPQSTTEEVLSRYLQSFGLKIERGLELVGLEETDSKVIAVVQSSSNQKKQIEAKWVIGCDGAHSFVRKHLYLTFEGKAFSDVFSLADVKLDWKYAHGEVFAFWSQKGILAAIPLPEKGFYRLIFQLDRCQTSVQKFTEDNLQVDLPPPSIEEVQETVRERADPNAIISNPKWLANFHLNSRLVNRYQVGKYFLAGDAAHIHSPVGGQGMNTGIQDAFNLAWKIAFVHYGKASFNLLDSYHQERHAIARRLLQGTEAGTHIAALKKPWKISLRNIIASMLLHIPSLEKKLIRAVAQTGITYPSSQVISEKGSFKGGPKVGSRMPDLELKDGTNQLKLFDVFKKIDSFFVFLLVGEGARYQEIEKLLVELGKSPLPIKPVVVAKELAAPSDSHIYLDPTGKFHDALGVQKNACYVVRPDTYIGYRGTPIDTEALLTYFNQYS